MIKCDKCGAINSDERLICCDCGRELNRKADSSFSVVPEFKPSSNTGSSNVGLNMDAEKYGRCKKCGQKFLPGDRFCLKCGAMLDSFSGVSSAEKSSKPKKNRFVIVLLSLLFAILLLLLLNLIFGISFINDINGSRRYRMRFRKKESFAHLQIKDIPSYKNIPF